MPRRAGACRSRSPAACLPRTCPPRAALSCSAAAGIAAGVWAPRGKARPVDGGFVVSGRWAFCSGITHSDFLFAGCIDRGDRAAARADAERGRHPQGGPGDPRHVAHARPARHGQPRCRRRRGVRARRAHVLAVRRPGRSTARCTAFRASGSSRSRSARPRWATRAERSTSSSRWPRTRWDWARPARLPSARPPKPRSPRPRRRCAPRGRVLRGDRGGLAGSPGRRAGLGRAAQRPSPGGHARGSHLRRRRASMYDLGGGSGDLRRLAASAPVPRRLHGDRALPGQRSVSRASRAAAAGPAQPTPRRCEPADRRRAAVLARPAGRGGAGHRARGQRAGFGTLWIGEMATFDAVALATAIGHRARGPAAEDRPAGGRRPSPVAMALARVVGGDPHR